MIADDAIVAAIDSAIARHRLTAKRHNARARLAAKNLVAARYETEKRNYARAAVLLEMAQSGIRASKEPDQERDNEITRALVSLAAAR